MSAQNIASAIDSRAALPEYRIGTRTATIDRWEQEEISRSAEEARNTRIRRTDCRRYTAPSADTAYPLEYAFYLVGNLWDRITVDLGCGSGENTIILAMKGARVTGIDISPQLLQLAAERLHLTGSEAELRQASAYKTGLPNESVDVIFCVAILHHLDLLGARQEVYRILRPGGVVIAMEPVRDSKCYARLRNVIPIRGTEVSRLERPLAFSDINEFAVGFEKSECRRFRLPFIPLLKVLHLDSMQVAWKLDRKLLKTLPSLSRYATIEVFKLRKIAHSPV